MDAVADDLYVGTAADATDDSLLETHGVTTIVSLTHETPRPTTQDLTLRSIPLIDGPQHSREQFTKAVEETLAALAADGSVLVHCSAGASRSPTVAATALALAQDMDLEDALQQVADNRAAVDPHEALLRQAAHVYTQLNSGS
jgi:protein-tyrosine phosphatase